MQGLTNNMVTTVPSRSDSVAENSLSTRGHTISVIDTIKAIDKALHTVADKHKFLSDLKLLIKSIQQKHNGIGGELEIYNSDSLCAMIGDTFSTGEEIIKTFTFFALHEFSSRNNKGTELFGTCHYTHKIQQLLAFMEAKEREL